VERQSADAYANAKPTVDMHKLLQHMVSSNASDLHIKPGVPPGLRIDGKIIPQMVFGKVTPEMSRDAVNQIMTPQQIDRFDAEKDLDFSYSVKGLARFRVNVLMQRGSVSAVLRMIPDEIPDAKALGLPLVCLEMALKPRGLVLVTGPTGSGKTTTLAAMIDHVNKNMRGHILTMEDPIEFIHPDKNCYVTQRQINVDCMSFAQALRRALRQDPDVILIGEMRDLETISNAITAAETGHLVLGTLHTTGAISTVDRIIDVFPHEAQQQVRVQLSGTLQAVISQVLVPRTGGGRVAAREILVATDAVRSLIREGKTPQLLNQLQTGTKQQMTTLEASLANLVAHGLIDYEDALAKANRPEEVAKSKTSSTRMADPFSDGGGGVSSTGSGKRRAVKPAEPGPGSGAGTTTFGKRRTY